MTDRSFIHLALNVADLEASIAFYTRYAGMKVVHRRHDKGGGETAWLNDGNRPFVLVLVAYRRRSVGRMVLRSIARAISRYVARPAHLGIACASRADVESLCRHAASEGRLRKPANDAGPVVGFYGMLSDPDGYNLELSYGQEVGMTPTLTVDAPGSVSARMPNETREGGCLCGALRYRFSGPPVDAGYCHCRRCQRSSGAPVLAWLTGSVTQFAYLQGEPAVFHSSPHAQRERCRSCGTQIAFRRSSGATTVDVTIASLDDPTGVVPEYHIWRAARIGWFETHDDLPRHDDAGPDADAI